LINYPKNIGNRQGFSPKKVFQAMDFAFFHGSNVIIKQKTVKCQIFLKNLALNKGALNCIIWEHIKLR
jgi:hypothetical protein